MNAECEVSLRKLSDDDIWAALTDLDPWHAPWWLERGQTALRDGRDKWARLYLSRALARDQPIARDLASNLLDTADRLSAGRDSPGGAAAAAVAATNETPPTPTSLPAKGAPASAQ